MSSPNPIRLEHQLHGIVGFQTVAHDFSHWQRAWIAHATAPVRPRVVAARPPENKRFMRLLWDSLWWWKWPGPYLWWSGLPSHFAGKQWFDHGKHKRALVYTWVDIYNINIYIYIYTLYICIIYYRVSRFYLCVSPASGMDGFPMQSHNFCLMKRVRRSFFCLQHLEHLSIHTFVGRICYEILWMRTFRTFRTSLIELDWILHNLLCRALNFRTQEVTPGTSADTANGQAAVATGNPRESQRLLMGINGNHIYWLMPT